MMSTKWICIICEKVSALLRCTSNYYWLSFFIFRSNFLSWPNVALPTGTVSSGVRFISFRFVCIYLYSHIMLWCMRFSSVPHVHSTTFLFMLFSSSNFPISPNNYRLWRIAKICAFPRRAPRIARIQMDAVSSPAATARVPPGIATRVEIVGKYN